MRPLHSQPLSPLFRHHRYRQWMICAGAMLATFGAHAETTTVINAPGPGQNHIEVSGNTAQRVMVRCSDKAGVPPGNQADVNSVNLDRKALIGRTVIVRGRNTHDVRAVRPCDDEPAPSVNVNSVNIN